MNDKFQVFVVQGYGYVAKGKCYSQLGKVFEDYVRHYFNYTLSFCTTEERTVAYWKEHWR